MAVIWETVRDGQRYQVRTAGRSVRLYEGGILHTQTHPERLFTGSVWDLLALPALMMPARSIRRVLVLGVGGGSVLRQLQHLVGPVHITGVEYNELHLRLAQRFFGLGPKVADLVHAEAGAFVHAWAGEPFDMIIDDIFAEKDGQPARAITADATWLTALRRLLSPTGVLVTNFVSAREFRVSAHGPKHLDRQLFAAGFSLSTPHCENIITALFRHPVREGDLAAALTQHPLTRKASVRRVLRYRLRQFL
jgi:predicted membrane-bound spermidine synthase